MNYCNKTLLRIAHGAQVLLRDLGMSASTEWRAVEKQLRDLDMDSAGVLEQKERQRLFLEVRGELAAEQGFKTLLESAPEISASTSWPLAKRQVCISLTIGLPSAVFRRKAGRRPIPDCLLSLRLVLQCAPSPTQ